MKTIKVVRTIAEVFGWVFIGLILLTVGAIFLKTTVVAIQTQISVDVAL